MLMLMLNQWEAVDPCPKNMSSVLCYQSTLYIIDFAHPAGRSLLKCNDFVSVTFRGKETKPDQNQSSGPPEPQPNRVPLKIEWIQVPICLSGPKAGCGLSHR